MVQAIVPGWPTIVRGEYSIVTTSHVCSFARRRRSYSQRQSVVTLPNSMTIQSHLTAHTDSRGPAEPLVTVGITTFNRSQLLPRAIDSVLAQTYTDFELYVVDDHSSDCTREVVAKYSDSRIRYHRNDTNSGVSASRNLVLKSARGRYVAYLDDDDAWAPEKLELQVNLAELQSADCAVIYCGCIVENDARRVLNVVVPRIRGDIRTHVTQGRLSTIPSSHLFRTGLLRNVGGYDTTLRNHEEHDVWMNLALCGHTADYVDSPLVLARAHLGYRLTSDVEARWTATDRYLRKWHEHFVRWMGVERARRYEQEYRARVMSGVARESILRNHYQGVRHAAMFLVRRWPKGVTTRCISRFVALLVVGFAVDRLPRLRRALGALRR